MSKFYVLEGPLRGKSFELTELASIGRDETCAVRLDGRHISRIHARLEKRGDSMMIRDNGSRNGIFVNGRSVKESVLRADDQLEIGEHVLVFDPTSDPAKHIRSAAMVVESVSDPFSQVEPDPRHAKLLAMAATLTAMDGEKEIARALLEALMLAIAPQRGFVMIADEAGQLKPAARKAPSGDEEFFLSNVLFHAVSKERRSILAVDVLRKEPNAGKRVAILCAPLATPSMFAGLVYLESKLAEGQSKSPFKSLDLRFAAMLSAFAGARIAQILRAPFPTKLGEVSFSKLTAAFEKECVVEALRRTKGDLQGAAKLLGLSRSAFDEKLKALGIDAAAPPAAAGWKSVQV